MKRHGYGDEFSESDMSPCPKYECSNFKPWYFRRMKFSKNSDITRTALLFLLNEDYLRSCQKYYLLSYFERKFKRVLIELLNLSDFYLKCNDSLQLHYL